MLPISARNDYLKISSKDSRIPAFVQRLCDFKQMDFESAFDQILNLLSLEPQRV